MVRVVIEGGPSACFAWGPWDASRSPDATLTLTRDDADALLAGHAPQAPVFEGDLELLDQFLAQCVQPLPWFAAELRSGR